MKSIITANRTGGQGKSLVAQMIAVGFAAENLPLKLAAADTVAEGESSKLGHFFPGQVRELGIGASLEEIAENDQSAVEYGNQVGEILLEGGYLIDCGANVVDTIWSWARVQGAADVLAEFDVPAPALVVPVTASAKALQDALALLEMSFQSADALPISERYLILNESLGSFENYGNSGDLQKIQGMVDKGLKITTMPHCKNIVWPFLERDYVSMATILGMDAKEAISKYRTEYGLSPFNSTGAHKKLVDWAKTTLTNFREVGLIPTAPEETSSPEPKKPTASARRQKAEATSEE